MANDEPGKKEKKKHKKSKKDKEEGKARKDEPEQLGTSPRFAPEAGYEVTSSTLKLAWAADGTQELWLLRLPLDWPRQGKGTLKVETQEGGTVAGQCTDSEGQDFHVVAERGDVSGQVYAADMGSSQPIAVTQHLTLIRTSQLELPAPQRRRTEESTASEATLGEEKKAKKRKRKAEELGEEAALGSDSSGKKSKRDKHEIKVKRQKHKKKEISTA